jgi:hypothetical protein
MKNIHEHAVMSFMAKTLANGIPWHVRTPQDAGEQDHRYLLYLHSPQVYLFFLTDKFIYFDTQVNGRKSRRSNERTKTKEHTIFFFFKKKPHPFLFRSSLAFPAPGRQDPSPPTATKSLEHLKSRNHLSPSGTSLLPSHPAAAAHLHRSKSPCTFRSGSGPIQLPSALRSIKPMPRLASQTLAAAPAAGGTACIA